VASDKARVWHSFHVPAKNERWLKPAKWLNLLRRCTGSYTDQGCYETLTVKTEKVLDKNSKTGNSAAHPLETQNGRSESLRSSCRFANKFWTLRKEGKRLICTTFSRDIAPRINSLCSICALAAVSLHTRAFLIDEVEENRSMERSYPPTDRGLAAPLIVAHASPAVDTFR